MSNSVINWARTVRGISGTQKLVLLLLADRVNADRQCWPAVANLADEACLTRRATQLAINALEVAGLIQKAAGGGRHQTHVFTLITERSAPVPQPETANVVHLNAEMCRLETVNDVPKRANHVPKRANHVPKRANHVHPNPKEPKRTLRNPHQSATRGTRLSPDWWPSSADLAFAREEGLDPIKVADEFRDYWAGVPGAKGLKADWSATFRNRCRNIAERTAARKQPGKLDWVDDHPLFRRQS